MNELRDRGVADILIAVVDGLKGFPEAINAVFPNTQVLGLRRQHQLSRHTIPLKSTL
jgi:transposase-like protein